MSLEGLASCFVRSELSSFVAKNGISYSQWQSEFSDADPALDESADDEVVQLYTSETTDKPKGAILTDRSLLALRGQEQDDVLQDWQLYAQGETGLLAMPCFHVGGTSFGLGIIHSGAHAVIIPEYDPNEILTLIEKYQVSKIFMVPAALKIILENPRINEVDLTSLTTIFYGASPIPSELMRESIERFGCGFVQMYGMTESGGTIKAIACIEDPSVIKRILDHLDQRETKYQQTSQHRQPSSRAPPMQG